MLVRQHSTLAKFQKVAELGAFSFFFQYHCTEFALPAPIHYHSHIRAGVNGFVAELSPPFANDPVWRLCHSVEVRCAPAH